MVKYFFANWKSNKNFQDSREWIKQFRSFISNTNRANIGICAPFTLLSTIKEEALKLNLSISLVAQNISPYEEGQYTGEIAATMIKDLVSYALIGHSERRNYFSEKKEEINKKLIMADTTNITPILCISDTKELDDSKETLLKLQKFLILYEPLDAIGTGNPQDPNVAEEFCVGVKTILPKTPVLYGGSTSPENVKLFLSKSSIDGVVVGHNSLNPYAFYQIIKNGVELFNVTG